MCNKEGHSLGWGPCPTVNKYASLGFGGGVSACHRTQLRRISYVPTAPTHTVLTKSHGYFYVPKEEGGDQEGAFSTNQQCEHPLSSEETHFLEMCCFILGVDYRDKIEQISAKVVEGG